MMERESGIIRNIDIRYQDDNKHILTAINIAQCLRFVVISNDTGRSSIIVVPGAQQVKTSREDRKVLQTSFSLRKLASSEHSNTWCLSFLIVRSLFLRLPPRRLLKRG